MTEPAFRFVSAPTALSGAPAGWAAEMLRDGQIALLGGHEPEAVDQVAHDLGQPAILVLRSESSPERQAETVMSWAAHLPLIWVGSGFSDDVQNWAHRRGPMTLLVGADQPLGDDQRRTVDRFVASLGRQSE